MTPPLPPTPQISQNLDVFCLRDYFAAAALTGMCHHVTKQGYPIHETMEVTWAAESAYHFADAMLKAREVRP